MPTIHALPEELLAHIMIYCAEIPALQKLHMSHVCWRWRAAALSTSRFWATINAHALCDLGVLAVLLERSGTAALYARIEGIIDEEDCDGDIVCQSVFMQVSLLASHALRLCALELDFYVVDTSRKVLRSGLYFPVLETMIIHGTRVDFDDSDTIVFNWISPALRCLKLTMAQPLGGWTKLFQQSPLIEHLSLMLYGLPNSEVQTCFALCRQLREFEICTICLFSRAFDAPEDGWHASSSLRAINLYLDEDDMLEILRGLSATFMASITLTTFSGIGFPDHPLAQHLTRGLGQINVFDVVDKHSLRFCDDKGSERLTVTDADLDTRHVTTLWQYLCNNHSAATAVASFTLSSENWYHYSSAFSAKSPVGDVELRLTRGLWDRRKGRIDRRGRQSTTVFVVDSDGDVSGDGEDFRCDGARRVRFEADGADTRDIVPLKAVLGLIKSASSIELCLCITKHGNLWRGKVESLLGCLNAMHSSAWTLCTLCATASHR